MRQKQPLGALEATGRHYAALVYNLGSQDHFPLRGTGTLGSAVWGHDGGAVRSPEPEHPGWSVSQAARLRSAGSNPCPEEIRAQHVWILGPPGYGKSTLMHWMAVEDIAAGKGLTVIDPAGDLVGNGLLDDPERHVPGLVDWIPYERINDTIYIDLRQPLPIDIS